MLMESTIRYGARPGNRCPISLNRTDSFNGYLLPKGSGICRVGNMQTPDRINRLWPDESKGPWLLTLHLAVVSGRMECVGVDLRSYLRRGVDDPADLERWQGLFPVASDYGDEELEMEIRQPGKAYGLMEASQGGKVLFRSEQRDIVPLNSSALRIPLGSLIAKSRDRATNALETLATRAASDVDRDALLEKARTYARDARSGRGRKGLPVEHYMDVARIYKQAHARGENPTQAVSKHFHVSKSTAGKKVARSRELGLLGPATKGKPGETGRTA